MGSLGHVCRLEKSLLDGKGSFVVRAKNISLLVGLELEMHTYTVRSGAGSMLGQKELD